MGRYASFAASVHAIFISASTDLFLFATQSFTAPTFFFCNAILYGTDLFLLQRILYGNDLCYVRRMDFGVFDHLDRSDLPLDEFYEARLKLIESYDTSGFYAYHLAEHHFTPLGMAPSPSLFLSAIAQRTRRLRFGPLVYALPLHHPLRLIEEICMLDQLSGGRLEIGFGRGSSPVEISLYGQQPDKAPEMYAEALEIILQGLKKGIVNFAGRFFTVEGVPLVLEPLQKPHPPIWYGVHSVESSERAARNALNAVSLDSARETRLFF